LPKGKLQEEAGYSWQLWSGAQGHSTGRTELLLLLLYVVFPSCRVLTLIYIKQEIMCVMCKMLQLLIRHSLWFM
jgi:hypothetical protein